MFTPAFSPAYFLLSPNRIVPAAPTPMRSPTRLRSPATGGGTGRIGNPATQAVRVSAHGTKDAPRRSPGRSSHCPPNRHPIRARSPGRSPHRPPTPGGSPTVPAGDHLVVRRVDCSPPKLVAAPVGVPRPLASATTTTGERWEARGGLVVHGTARGAGHPRCAPPQPQGAAVGFALDDPYVEQVWVGVIGPSALLVLRRLPVLWHEREPAVVDLSELGQSLGLGPSLTAQRAPVASHRTARRLRDGPLAARATAAGCALRWRHSAAASLHSIDQAKQALGDLEDGQAAPHAFLGVDAVDMTARLSTSSASRSTMARSWSP